MSSYYREDDGKENHADAGGDGSHPSELTPEGACEEGAEGATNEVGYHEDGVHATGG